jgi:hypothetical protein
MKQTYKRDLPLHRRDACFAERRLVVVHYTAITQFFNELVQDDPRICSVKVNLTLPSARRGVLGQL